MRILRYVTAVLAALVLAVFSGALAEGTYYGSVVCDQPVTVAAPYSGVVSGLSVRRGERIHDGDRICTVETVSVFSPVKGTVSAVFGAGGDSVEEVKGRRGGVIYIVPEAMYTIRATNTDVNKNTESFVSVGQKVWLRIGRTNAPVAGTGTVTEVASDGENQGSFSVEADTGVYALEDNVFVYRKESGGSAALIGMGTVQQTPPVVISGEGSIFRMHVKPGSEVSRGSLLFETVPGTMKAMKNGDSRITSKTDGIVASVEAGNGMYLEQNSTLITIYPLEAMRVCVTVPETSLALFPEGKAVRLTFGTDDEREGVVRAVDYLSALDENTQAAAGYANYKVYIDFDRKDGVRQGMLVAVDLP